MRSSPFIKVDVVRSLFSIDVKYSLPKQARAFDQNQVTIDNIGYCGEKTNTSFIKCTLKNS